jgi:hypothetical protein
MSHPIPDSATITRVLQYDRRQMAERGRRGGQRTAQVRDGRAAMEKARAVRDQRLAECADPEGVLPPEERERRIAALRSAHFRRLSHLAVAARRARQEAQEVAS